MAIEVHLDGQEQVPGLRDGLGEGHHPTVVAHLPGGEKALLIAAGDGQLHAVPGDGTGGAHAENHRGHLDVGGEREVVVGYSQRQLVALLILMAGQALTAAARKVDRETRRGLGPVQQAEKQQSAGKRGIAMQGFPPPLWPVQSMGRAPLTHLWEVPWASGLLTRALDSSNTPRGRWVAGAKGLPRLRCVPFSLAEPHPGLHSPGTPCPPSGTGLLALQWSGLHRALGGGGRGGGGVEEMTPDVIIFVTSNHGRCHLSSVRWLFTTIHSLV